MTLLQMIAVLCQLNSSDPRAAALEQARCQAYFVTCVDESRYPTDYVPTLKACISTRAMRQ